jgi:hypothetical protein
MYACMYVVVCYLLAAVSVIYSQRLLLLLMAVSETTLETRSTAGRRERRGHIRSRVITVYYDLISGLLGLGIIRYQVCWDD